MGDACRHPRAGGAGAARAAEGAFEEHAGECPACRREGAADAALRDAFRGVPLPQLSPHFDREVLLTLARERRLRRARAGRRRLLQAYWLLAAAASVAVVWSLPWREHSMAGAPVLLATLAAGAVLPLALLVVVLRKDPVAVLFETVDWLS